MGLDVVIALLGLFGYLYLKVLMEVVMVRLSNHYYKCNPFQSSMEEWQVEKKSGRGRKFVAGSDQRFLWEDPPQMLRWELWRILPSSSRSVKEKGEEEEKDPNEDYIDPHDLFFFDPLSSRDWIRPNGPSYTGCHSNHTLFSVQGIRRKCSFLIARSFGICGKWINQDTILVLDRRDWTLAISWWK